MARDIQNGVAGGVTWTILAFMCGGRVGLPLALSTGFASLPQKCFAEFYCILPFGFSIPAAKNQV